MCVCGGGGMFGVRGGGTVTVKSAVVVGLIRDR